MYTNTLKKQPKEFCLRTLRNITLSALLALLLFSCACYAQTGEDDMLELARTHFNSGNYYFATTWLGRILTTYPASPHRKEVLLMISKAYTLSGREEKAVPYLHKLLDEFPETATKLDPQLLKLAQSGEPARPAAIVSPSPPQSPPAEKTTDPAIKASAVPATPVLPKTAPALGPAEPVSTPTAAPAPAVTAEKATGGSAVVKPSETAERISPSPQEQSPPATKLTPPDTTAGQLLAVTAAQPSAAATLQPRSEGVEQVYYVLAGETINRHKIEPLLKKLKEAGLQPIIREETKSREVFRLVADCYADRISAEKRLPQISRMTRSSFLIRDENTYCIVAGSLSSEKAALQEQKRMEGKGLQVEIARYKVPLTVWQVIIGRFTHPPDAEKVVNTLAARGVAATVINHEADYPQE
jgi:hypothetical protein